MATQITFEDLYMIAQDADLSAPLRDKAEMLISRALDLVAPEDIAFPPEPEYDPFPGGEDEDEDDGRGGTPALRIVTGDGPPPLTARNPLPAATDAEVETFRNSERYKFVAERMANGTLPKVLLRAGGAYAYRRSPDDVAVPAASLDEAIDALIEG